MIDLLLHPHEEIFDELFYPWSFYKDIYVSEHKYLRNHES